MYEPLSFHEVFHDERDSMPCVGHACFAFTVGIPFLSFPLFPIFFHNCSKPISNSYHLCQCSALPMSRSLYVTCSSDSPYACPWKIQFMFFKYVVVHLRNIGVLRHYKTEVHPFFSTYPLAPNPTLPHPTSTINKSSISLYVNLIFKSCRV